MVHELVQLLFGHPGICTRLYDSGTWGLKAVYIVIFWKLRNKKETSLNLLFLFSLNTTLCTWLFAKSSLAQGYVKNISPWQSRGAELLACG